MDDRRGVPLLADLIAALRGERRPVPRHADGRAPPEPRGPAASRFEGGEGAGKTTQARLLAIWLRDQGFDVVATREPGATKVGHAAARAAAGHRARPGCRRGPRRCCTPPTGPSTWPRSSARRWSAARWSITDRYVDSSLAYQGAGRGAAGRRDRRAEHVGDRRPAPDLTILLDLPPADRAAPARPRSGRPAGGRAAGVPRAGPAGFLALAAGRAPTATWCSTRPGRPARSAGEIQDRVRELLPDPVPHDGRGRHRRASRRCRD